MRKSRKENLGCWEAQLNGSALWSSPLGLVEGGMINFLACEGFELIGIAAMLSTASAINGMVYGAARLSYAIAKDGELPSLLERKVWGKPPQSG